MRVKIKNAPINLVDLRSKDLESRELWGVNHKVQHSNVTSKDLLYSCGGDWVLLVV